MKPNERKDKFPSIEQIKERAQGRKIDILEHVAGIPAEYLDGKHHPCPACGGTDRFRRLDRDAGAVFCNQCFNENNGDFIEAVRHYRGVDRREALRLIGEYLGSPGTQSPARGTTSKKLAGTWIYSDQAGEPRYRVKRFEWTENGEPKKSFFQERYVNGKWELGLKNVEPIPYNWQAISERSDEPVYIVEGEKCCDVLSALRLLATTASGGSNSKTDWSKYLSGRKVVIFPDNDNPGCEYTLRIADQLHGSNEVKVVFLPGLAHKGDVADWITAGGTRDELVRIVKTTPLWDGKPFSYKSDGPNDKTGTPPAGKDKSNGIPYVPKLINPEHVKSQPIHWLWENKIPLEMITVFAGRQGGGKTFWSCYLAAVITNGWKWPDGTESPMGSVLFFYGEDLIDKTMIPRLRAQGADLSKIRILDGFTKMMDGEEVGELELTLKAVDQIRDAIHATEQETGHPVRMVVVDPVSNHWGGIKENDNAQVREVLKPIQRLAGETGSAFLLITHFGKAIKEEAADKVIGSIAITAVARTVWHLYRDKDRKDTRYFVPSKDNVLIDPTGVEFTVNRQAGGRVEVICCDLEKHADDIEAEQFAQMRDKMQGRGRKPEQTEAASVWLENFLADGEKPAGSENDPAAGSVRCESEIAGHSWASIRRASDRLGVVKRKNLTVWFWALPLPQNQLAQNEEPRHSDNFEQVASPDNLSTYESTCSTCSKFNSVGNSGQVDLLSLAEPPPEGGEVSTPPAKKPVSTGPKVYDFEEHMKHRKEGRQ